MPSTKLVGGHGRLAIFGHSQSSLFANIAFQISAPNSVAKGSSILKRVILKLYELNLIFLFKNLSAHKHQHVRFLKAIFSKLCRMEAEMLLITNNGCYSNKS